MSAHSSPLSLFWDHIVEVSDEQGITLEETCRLVHRMGYDAVDIFDEKLTAENVQTLHDAGMSISLVFAFMPIDKNFRFHCENLADLTEQYNIPCTMVLPQENLQPMTATLWTDLFDTLRQLQAILAQTEHTLVIEPFDFAGFSFNCIEGMQRYMREIPGLKVCFDTGNFIYSGLDCQQAYSILKGNIAHIHLKDRLRDETYGPCICTTKNGDKLSSAPVGKGIIPIRQIIDQLLQDGYSGALTVEQHRCRKQLDALRASAEYIRQILHLPSSNFK